ncbi:KRR1 small subunit processome component protein [Gryllus bimaculatus]|nr:KRR1 small subunit processome component protein [Gryllus bimaculatus]
MMNMRFLHFLFIFVHILVVSKINAQTTHDSDGSVCVTSDGEDGECLQLPQCPRVLSAITRGIRNHTRCGFVGAVELVCCAQKPGIASTTNVILKLHTSTIFPRAASYIESSTRGTHWHPFHVEESAVSTVCPSTTTIAPTTSTTVKPRENYVEESENEVEDIDLDTSGVNEDVEDRLFLGNRDKDNNKISPSLFAFNTLTGFVNAFLGKPPPPQPSPTKFPPLFRPVTIPPSQIYTSPINVLHNERIVTRKPGSSHPPTMFPLSTSTQKPILNIQPNEIITNIPKPSQDPVRYPNPIPPWPSTYSTNSPGINIVRPEYPFIMKPSPLPEVSTKKPFVSVHMPLTEKPITGGINMPSALPRPTHSSSENTLVDNVEILLPEPSTEVEFSTIPDIPGLEPVATEIPAWSDAQTLPPDVLVIPDVPFVTPIPADDPSLSPDGDFPTLEPLATESSSEKISVGTKSQEGGPGVPEAPPSPADVDVRRDTAQRGVRAHRGSLRQNTIVAVRDAAVHPGYSAASRAHDVALLRLATPVAFSQFVHPACLHGAHAPPAGQLLVTGWGSDRHQRTI